MTKPSLKLITTGFEIFASFLVSMGLSWLIGQWRGWPKVYILLLGMGLAALTNVWILIKTFRKP
jgi:hypothetical protein